MTGNGGLLPEGKLPWSPNPTRRSWPIATGINQADDIEETGTPKK
jgi:hypothetical protein